LVAAGALWGLAWGVSAQPAPHIPDFYAEPGIYPTRNYINQNFAEHIDPFTGILQHHYVDAYIPGPGGMDLKVQRSYSAPQDMVDYSTQYALGFPSPTGVGWTMHFGRVLKVDTNFCNRETSTSSNAVLELPDGSRRILFPATGVSADFISIDRWKADCAPGTTLTVYSPEGLRYDMNYPSIAGQAYALNVTRITDRNNNSISINYTIGTGQVALISSVTTSDGRSLTYSYVGGSPTEVARISTISTGSATWGYGYTQISDSTYPNLRSYYQGRDV